MTFDDDFLCFDFGQLGIQRVTCKQQGVDWPPPEHVDVNIMDGKKLMRVCTFERVRYSAITDEQRQGMSHVCRGAEYRRLS